MKNVLINLLSNSLGDTIASVPYVDEYRKREDVNIYFSISDLYINLLSKSYENINFIGRNFNNVFDLKIDIDYKFTENIQLGYAKQLGFENPKFIKPKLVINPTDKKIKNKYVCLSVHSTSQLKYWNHPLGRKVQPLQPYWTELSGMLRKRNLTPVVVEKNESFGLPPFFNGIPSKTNKKIGLEFDEILNLIYHCEFFIGLSSGLAWIAHALGKKVVLISNFTEDWNEFDLNDDNYIRIVNKNVCHGCFNKVNINYNFDSNDWYWCPLHKDTPREFECHKSITPDMVMNSIEKWL